MRRGRRVFPGLAVVALGALCLAAGLRGTARAQTPGVVAPPSAEAKAPAKEETKGRKAAEKLGLNFGASDAPLQINASRQTLRERPDGGRVSSWNGDVVLTQGDLKLSCQKLEISFASDQAGGAVQKIEAEGKVAITQRDIELQCDRAVYEEQSCVAVCERLNACKNQGPAIEPALLRQNKDVVRGGRIEFDVCSGDFQVSCGASGLFTPRPKDAKGEKKPETRAEKKPEAAK